jgi:hypothetical protein
MSEIIARFYDRVGQAILVFLFVCSAAWGQGVLCPPGCAPGRWSKDAVDLSSARSKAPYENRDIRVVSPDGQKIARIVNDKWWVEREGSKIFAEPKASSILYPAELAWAPDSKALYITESSGYTTGYHATIYRLENDTLHQVEGVNRLVQRDFDRHHRCSDGQLPNIAGLRWMEDSQRLVVVAEVPPLGICKDMGYFAGYMVSISGTTSRLLERYSPNAIETQWKDALGYRLKGDLEQLSAEQRAELPE